MGEHTSDLVDWTEAAEKICAAVEARISVTAKRAAETVYDSILADTQNYLRENTNFNLASQLTCREREAELLRKEASEHRATIAALVGALEFYADPKRYKGPNQRAVENDPYAKPDDAYLRDVTRDGGDIARAALQLARGSKGDE